MGYRSCVAIALYGDPKEVDMVDALLLQKLDPEYYRDLWEEQKQVKDVGNNQGDNTRMIVWTFDDVKWYSEMNEYKDRLFHWVNDINDGREGDETQPLCIEFARFGEDSGDTEVDRSMDSEYLLDIQRTISLPSDFEWRC